MSYVKSPKKSELFRKIENLRNVIEALRNPAYAHLDALKALLMPQDKEMSRREKDYLEVFKNSCLQMYIQIENVALEQELEFGSIEIHESLFDFRELVSELIKENETMFKFGELTVNFRDCGEIKTTADKAKIERVLNILFINAINYSNSMSELEITLRKDLKYITFQMKNRAPHIKPQDFPRLFEKYRPIEIKGKNTGIGLGLYIAKQLIEAHKGKMIALSYENDTNIFGFQIPSRGLEIEDIFGDEIPMW